MKTYLLKYILITVLFILILNACKPTERGDIIISNVNVIDAIDGKVIQGQDVIIEDGIIKKILPVGESKLQSSRLLNGKGKYLIPGFINTHAHMRENFSRPLLAFGITTVRDPGPVAEEGIPGASLGISLRDCLNAGEAVGPRMLTAGRKINNSDVFDPTPEQDTGDTGVTGNFLEVRSEEDIRKEVQHQSDVGYDFIKLYMGIDSSLLHAAVDEAVKQNIKVIGHLKTTSWTEAAGSGIDGLMHSCNEGPTWELLEPSVREVYDWSTWPSSMRSWAATVSSITLEGSRWEALINALVINRTEVNPTLAIFEGFCWADESSHLAQEQPPFAPENYAARWQNHWQSQSNFMSAQGFVDADFKAFKTAFSTSLKMIGAMHARGVLLTAGDDVGGQMTPGVSFHRELKLLTDAGISNMDVIKIATRNGAEALGILDEVGTIESGQRADLVILNQNPIDDILNTLSVDAIIHDGVIYKPKDLLHD